MGWLHSTPKSKNDDAPRRYDSFPEGSNGLDMPDCDTLLLNVFGGVGMFEVSMAGLQRVSWGELKNYLELTATNLNPWEVSVVIEMSINYCGWFNKGKEPDCKCPWHSEAYNYDAMMEENRKRVWEGFKKLKEQRKELKRK